MRRTEVQGRRGDGETGKGAGASARGASAGPGCLPGGARPRHSARPLPHLPIPPPEAGQGKYPPRGLLVPEQVWQPMHSQNPGVHPRPVPTISPASPPDAPPEHGRDEDPHRASDVPQPGTRLSGDLDPVGRAPERTERTICAQRGGTPREI